MKRILLSACAMLATLLSFPISAGATVDVLASPSMRSPLAPHSLITGLASAGDRLVAVGQRGHILYSDDHGGHWLQASVPVSSDLTAVWFASARQGWAVGHDGVVLHSEDGGVNWMLQLDGKRAALAMRDLYSRQGGERLAADALRFVEQGPDKPFLDVWFADEKNGYVVGAFGLLFHTTDGGRHWAPWMHESDNPRGLHLNAIRPVGGALYIAGEQGLLLRMEPGSMHFGAVRSPYEGSWFGIADSGGAILAYGLRGNAWRSVDGTAWRKVATGVQTGLTGAANLGDGRLVLVSLSGQLLLSTDNGASFHAVAAPPAQSAAVLGDGAGGVIIGGARGLRVQALGK